MKKNLELVLHWIIVVSTFCAVAVYLIPAFHISDHGITCFKYFTTDSNVLAFAASLLCIIYTRKDNRPGWLPVFRFVTTISVTVTFIIVVILLAPTMALENGSILTTMKFFFGKNSFVLHFSTPVLSVAALLISRDRLDKKACLWAVLPVFVYSIFYLITVILMRIWDDWYGFTFGGHYGLTPIVMLGMYVLTALLAFAEWKIHAALLHASGDN